MIKKIISLICMFCIMIYLTGCSSAWEGSDTAKQDKKINEDFVQINGYKNLYYCKDTDIVYWIGGSYQVNVIGEDYTTSYITVYYAPNGLPYRFNKRLGLIEEIDGGLYEYVFNNNHDSVSVNASN